MTTLDERLRELAEATHAQIGPSPELYRRISESTAPRPVVTWWSRPRRVLAAAAAVVAVVCGVAVVHPARHHPLHVAGTPITKQQWIDQMNKACRQALGGGGGGGSGPSPGNNTEVVFPTKQGYLAAAASRLPSIQADFDGSDPATAGPMPPDAVPVYKTVHDDLGKAVAELHAVMNAANDPNAPVPVNEWALANQYAAAAAQALVDYGATEC